VMNKSSNSVWETVFIGSPSFLPGVDTRRSVALRLDDGVSPPLQAAFLRQYIHCMP